jgi:hypothetical protein
MSICATYDPNCYGCQLRDKGTYVSTAATPNRLSNTKRVLPPPVQQPSWEAGIKVDRRCDGSVMPVASANGLHPMPITEYVEKRHTVDSNLRRAHGGE